MRAAGIGEDQPIGNLARQRDHTLAQCGKNDRRQRADPVIGSDLANKGADVSERLARRHSHALNRWQMCDADAELETAARYLVQIRGIVGEFLGGRAA